MIATGRVLDASALAALCSGNIAAGTWLAVSRQLSMTLYVPRLARAEVETVRPLTVSLLQLLDEHPQVLFADPGRSDMREVNKLLGQAGVFDALAAIVVYIARTRRWPVLTTDPGRLTRIDPDVEIELL